MQAIDPVVGGVNHLPLVTELRVDGGDGFALLDGWLADGGGRLDQPLWMDPPEGMHWRKVSEGAGWTKRDVLANLALKLELYRRFGVLPGSSDTHVSEFFAGFVTETSDFGRDWGVHHYGLAGHRADKAADDAAFAQLAVAREVPPWPSGELVATLLEGMVEGSARRLPVNLPNTGQVTNLAPGVVVECMGVSDAAGVRPRDVVTVPGMLGEHLRRVAASQELTVQAALSGDRDLVLAALLCDPLAGRFPYETAVAVCDELLAATAPWLPQFS
jgi:alpha-galactosidase